MSQIANEKMVGRNFHRNTIFNVMVANGIKRLRARFSRVSDSELNNMVVIANFQSQRGEKLVGKSNPQGSRTIKLGGRIPTNRGL